MLVLSRNKGERIVIGNNVVLTVVDVRGDRVRLGFEGPTEVPIHREEVHLRLSGQDDSKPPEPPATPPSPT